MNAHQDWRGRAASAFLIAAALAALWPATAVRAAAAGAAQLPRVFYSPAERASITTRRMAGQPIAAAAAAFAPSAASRDIPLVAAAAVMVDAASVGTAGTPRPARVEGVTIGRQAQRAVWIGGRRIVDGGTWGRYRVSVTDDGARLRSADGAVHQVRVGMEIPP